MKNLAKVLFLSVYAVAVFFVSRFWVLGVFALFNIGMMVYTRLSPKKALIYMRGVAPFIIIAGLINIIAGSWQDGALVVARLALVCNLAQSFRRVINSMQLANAVETFCIPLKALKIEPRDAGLIVCIGIAFIPVLRRELDQIKCGLRAKGMPLKLKNVTYLFKPFLFGIFKRTDEISDALRAKAYS